MGTVTGAASASLSAQTAADCLCPAPARHCPALNIVSWHRVLSHALAPHLTPTHVDTGEKLDPEIEHQNIGHSLQKDLTASHSSHTTHLGREMQEET